jgi:hypothetical protein
VKELKAGRVDQVVEPLPSKCKPQYGHKKKVGLREYEMGHKREEIYHVARGKSKMGI